VKNRIFFKLLATFLIVIGSTAITLNLMMGGAWETSLRAEIERNLTQKTCRNRSPGGPSRRGAGVDHRFFRQGAG
jgi:hypothetical protein